PLRKWFNFKTPKPTIAPRFIEFALDLNTDREPRKHSRVLWINPLPKVDLYQDEEGYDMAEFTFMNKKSSSEIALDADLGEWLNLMLAKAYVKSDKPYTFKEMKTDFESSNLGEFEDVFSGELFDSLREFGLLVL
ncbi:MAG: hypothetical protein ACJAUH_001535, partial [Saprospiraceae bacterium]